MKKAKARSFGFRCAGNVYVAELMKMYRELTEKADRKK